jgi:sec-independent protein translocase protein TatA
MNLGTPELLIILVVVLLLFGASRLPKLARSLGEAKREFERGNIADDPAPKTTTKVIEERPVRSDNGSTTKVVEEKPIHPE